MDYDDRSQTTYIILDPSALVRGIGIIRQWIVKYELVIFIPDYTLRELDYLKKGISLLATNARESIRLIDKLTSMDEDYYMNPNASKNNDVKCTVLLQSPEEAGPSYSKCLKYKKKTPLVKDFPNFKTEFDTTSVAGLTKSSVVKENINVSARAEIPLRLRFLVRSCIQKQFVENNSRTPKNWIIITEDDITKIWLESFQLKVMHLSELNKSLNSRQNQGYDDDDNVNFKQINHPVLKKEKFGEMDYANRGKGKLWKP